MIDEQNTVTDLDIPFQRFLKPEELEEIRINSNSVTHHNREVLFRQNTRTSHIMFVRSGLVKVFKESKSHRTSLLKIATHGEYLGLVSVFGNKIHQYSASVVHACDIGYIDINCFNGIMKRNGEFAMCLIHAISEEALFILEKLLGQTHKQLPGRIADVILYFSDIIYKSPIFDFPLTRRELAEMAGTTKESFIRTLAEFKHDKIIDLDGRRVNINSMKIVRTLSDLG
jgi:CRP/FNR family transcriptional regulator, polysaccharide utilization system transcription regulator